MLKEGSMKVKGRRRREMDEWANEWTNEKTNEWMNEWANEQMNEWMNEWVNEWIRMIDFTKNTRNITISLNSTMKLKPWAV